MFGSSNTLDTDSKMDQNLDPATEIFIRNFKPSLELINEQPSTLEFNLQTNSSPSVEAAPNKIEKQRKTSRTGKKPKNSESTEIKSKPFLTPEEQKEKRMLKNRASAQKSRENVKNKLTSLDKVGEKIQRAVLNNPSIFQDMENKLDISLFLPSSKRIDQPKVIDEAFTHCLHKAHEFKMRAELAEKELKALQNLQSYKTSQ